MRGSPLQAVRADRSRPRCRRLGPAVRCPSGTLAAVSEREASAGRGWFITVEGPDGAGKTLVAGRLRDALVGRGIDVLATREPGGTRVGERVRRIVLDHEPTDPPLDPRTDALLFSAARAQLVAEVIRPALERGRVVLDARHVDSTLAYQGYGGGPLDCHAPRAPGVRDERPAARPDAAPRRSGRARPRPQAGRRADALRGGLRPRLPPAGPRGLSRPGRRGPGQVRGDRRDRPGRGRRGRRPGRDSGADRQHHGTSVGADAPPSVNRASTLVPGRLATAAHDADRAALERIAGATGQRSG